MAVIYTQFQRKSDSKWVTVSYSDEDSTPYYHEHGEGYATEAEAINAWQNSAERDRVFPRVDFEKIKAGIRHDGHLITDLRAQVELEEMNANRLAAALMWLDGECGTHAIAVTEALRLHAERRANAGDVPRAAEKD